MKQLGEGPSEERFKEFIEMGRKCVESGGLEKKGLFLDLERYEEEA